jgi:hypothetical protein
MIDKAAHELSTNSSKQLLDKVAIHQKKMESCKIYHLLLSLWPDPNLTDEESQKAISNLEYLVSFRFCITTLFNNCSSLIELNF